MHSPPQRLLDRPQLGAHPVPSTLAHEHEASPGGAAADVGEAKEVKRLRFTKTFLGSARRRKAAELDQAGLLRMQRQRELFHPLPQVRQELFSLCFVLEANDDIV